MALIKSIYLPFTLTSSRCVHACSGHPTLRADDGGCGSVRVRGRRVGCGRDAGAARVRHGVRGAGAGAAARLRAAEHGRVLVRAARSGHVPAGAAAYVLLCSFYSIPKLLYRSCVRS